MEAPVKMIRLRYASGEKFWEDYTQIKAGRLAYTTPSPVPEGTLLGFELHVPGLPQSFTMNGVVIRLEDTGRATPDKKLSRLMVAVTETSWKVLAELDAALRASTEYGERMGPPPPPAEPEAVALGPDDEGPSEPAPVPEPHHPPPPPPPPPKPQAPSPPKPPPPPAAAKPKPPPPAAPVKALQESDEIIMPEKTPPPVHHKPPSPPPKPPPPPAAAPPPPAPAPPAGPAEEVAAGEKTGLRMDWLRKVVGSKDYETKEEEPEAPPPPPVHLSDKRELTPAERERVKPVGEFIMDLAKAMLRSGYYAADHPGAKTAKTGLYEEFQKSLGEQKEIMLTSQETREKVDVLISGVLEEPVTVRAVVGAGLAEMFIPKLRDYFSRKGLLSFALKKELTEDHFGAFVDIMSDPKADKGEGAKVGDLLTRSLVTHGITEISTVFMDDMVVFEEQLPWRVEMTIHRLAKDLKVLPMFKNVTEAEIRAMKVRIIKDIVRPLRQPYLLKDIVLNCYVIAKHVSDVDPEELEQTIVDAFPMPILLPTSKFIFEELRVLKKKKEENPDSHNLAKRYSGVRRVLKWVAKRVVMEDVPGADKFLEDLYFNEILAFEELPPEVQYRINTLKLADEVRKNPADYVGGLEAANTADDALVFLRCFRRVVPLLLEQNDWATLPLTANAVAKVAAKSSHFQPGPDYPADPMDFVFQESLPGMAEAYQKIERADREKIDAIIPKFGPAGVELLIKVLAESNDRGVRKAALDILIQMSDLSRNRIREILDDQSAVWFLQRNALLVLGQIGDPANDLKRAQKFLKNPQPRLREEALNTLLRLSGKNAEPSILAALDDKDLKVQRRALALIALIPPPSAAFASKILALLAQDKPKDKDEATAQEQKLAQVIRQVGQMPNLPKLPEIEAALLALYEKRAPKTGLFSRLKKSLEGEEQSPILPATLDTLAHIGSGKALPLLQALAAQESPLAKKAEEALNSIKLRTDQK